MKGKADARDTRARILDAAMSVLAESGIKRLKQVDVAVRAGVRQSHLTYYFPKRDDLLRAVIAHATGLLVGGIRRAVADGRDAEADVLLRRLASSVGAREHMRMFIGMIVEADSDAAIRRMMVDATSRMEEALAAALGDAVSARARVILASVWGIGLYRFLIEPGWRRDPTSAWLRWAIDSLEARSTGRPRKSSRRRRKE